MILRKSTTADGHCACANHLHCDRDRSYKQDKAQFDYVRHGGLGWPKDLSEENDQHHDKSKCHEELSDLPEDNLEVSRLFYTRHHRRGLSEKVFAPVSETKA